MALILDRRHVGDWCWIDTPAGRIVIRVVEGGKIAIEAPATYSIKRPNMAKGGLK